MTDYSSAARRLKALGEPIRLKIMDMLSCRELCACDLLEGLTISQSTLSHHMKVLVETNLVRVRKDATWMFYSLNSDAIAMLHKELNEICSPKDQCICDAIEGGEA